MAPSKIGNRITFTDREREFHHIATGISLDKSVNPNPNYPLYYTG
ncbi:hypothetical protein [Echinicola pacifica]|nr:hypothetical protein [Echinicola pacifica]